MPCYFPNKQPSLIPELVSLNKNTATLKGNVNQIYINGFHFTKNSVVIMNEVVCFSFFNGSTELGFLIPWNNIFTPGVYSVQVVNPSNNFPMMINMNGMYDKSLISNSLLFTVIS